MIFSSNSLRFNNFPDPNPRVVIYTYYDHLLVQKQYERLIYDVPGFLSALGGSLGLYLGLSCLTFVYALIDLYFEKRHLFCGGRTKSGRKRSGGRNKNRVSVSKKNIFDFVKP